MGGHTGKLTSNENQETHKKLKNRLPPSLKFKSLSHSTENLSTSILANEPTKKTKNKKSSLIVSDVKGQWMWKSNTDPWSSLNPDEWKNYSDIENFIIEDAFWGKKGIALLDDYHINLSGNVQVSNKNLNNQRPVKRITTEQRINQQLRETRFVSNIIKFNNSFANEHVLRMNSLFTDALLDKLDILRKDLETKLPEIIEKAACGLIAEGKLIRKKQEAIWMVEQLRKVKGKSIKEVGECCAYLYTLESFLYHKLNETMTLTEDENYQCEWQNKLETLGPFALLLEQYINNSHYNILPIVYRSAYLTDEVIQTYYDFMNTAQQRIDDNNTMYLSFPVFISCSRNRTKTEQYGNVLFIINFTSTKSIDISKFSRYPDEEEELIKPNVKFIVKNLEFDSNSHKHFIYLTVI